MAHGAIEKTESVKIKQHESNSYGMDDFRSSVKNVVNFAQSLPGGIFTAPGVASPSNEGSSCGIQA